MAPISDLVESLDFVGPNPLPLGKGLCIFIEGYYTQGERLERSFWEVAAERPWRSRESASILLNTRRSPALTTACSWDSEMATG